MQDNSKNSRAIVGIFVGGKSTRMGRAKGELSSEIDEPVLLQRLFKGLRQAWVAVDILPIGKRVNYERFGYPSLGE